MKRWLIAAAVLTIVVSGFVYWQAMANQPLVRLGVLGQWTWRYDHYALNDRALTSLAGAALLGWLCYSTQRRLFELIGGRLTTFLLAAVLLCFWLQASFAYLNRAGFGQSVFWMVTPKANVDFAEAFKTETLADLMKQAHDPNRPFRIHLSTHPPGPVVFYLVQRRLWESVPQASERFAAIVEKLLPYASDAREEMEKNILARELSEIEKATLYSSMMLLWLAVAFGVVPLYFWAADLFDPATAIRAVGLYALIPSVLIFNPMTDQLYVPLGLSLLALYHLGLSRRDPAQLAFAGVLSFVAMQFSLAFLVVLFVFALYVGMEMLFERRALETLKLLAWAAGAFIVLIVICFLAGYNSLRVWQICVANNAHFNTLRTYWPWVAYNPLDFLLFLGLPVAVFLLRSVLRIVRSRSRDAAWRFVVAFCVSVILLNALGTNRGEVARLWMFLMPMAAAIAAHAMRDAEEERDWVFLGCFGLLFLQSLFFRLSFDVLLPSLE